MPLPYGKTISVKIPVTVVQPSTHDFSECSTCSSVKQSSETCGFKDDTSSRGTFRTLDLTSCPTLPSVPILEDDLRLMALQTPSYPDSTLSERRICVVRNNSRRATMDSVLRDINNISLSLHTWMSRPSAKKSGNRRSLLSVSSWNDDEEVSANDTTEERSMFTSPSVSQNSYYIEKHASLSSQENTLAPVAAPRTSSMLNVDAVMENSRLSSYLHPNRLTIMQDLDGDYIRRAWSLDTM